MSLIAFEEDSKQCSSYMLNESFKVKWCVSGLGSCGTCGTQQMCHKSRVSFCFLVGWSRWSDMKLAELINKRAYMVLAQLCNAFTAFIHSSSVAALCLSRSQWFTWLYCLYFWQTEQTKFDRKYSWHEQTIINVEVGRIGQTRASAGFNKLNLRLLKSFLRPLGMLFKCPC